METKKCIQCGKTFVKPYYESRNNWRTRKFCSKECHLGYSWVIKKCEYCGKEFKRRKSYSKGKVRFCSQLCFSRSRPDRGGKIKRICKYCKKEFLAKRHRLKKGRDIYCSQKCADKSHRGKNHWNWKGGVSRKNHRRETKEYKEWRMIIYRKDNFTCWICEEKQRHPIAHHLLSWKNYPKLRFSVSNGLTLCRCCHKIYAKQ